MLKRIEIENVRNLQSINIELQSRFNVFFGENGSGKTSVLEAIHILGLARSFRHHDISSVIRYESPQLSVIGRLIHNGTICPLGLEKDREGRSNIKVNGEKVATPATLAELLPLQLIHPASDELITSGPKIRRQFIDWGLFHVEPQFFPQWKCLQKVLKQRNAALKMQQPRNNVACWDREYAQVCHKIAVFRRKYLQDLRPVFLDIMKYLLAEAQLDLCYQQGWSEDESLEELLAKNFYRDMQLGYTQLGPQRDEILIQCGEVLAAEVFSRGEQKLVVIALRLAQGMLLKEKTGKNCIYLLDDFAAELDSQHRQKVIEILQKLQAQVFLTTINYEEVKDKMDFVNPQLFYVEHGRIKQV